MKLDRQWRTSPSLSANDYILQECSGRQTVTLLKPLFNSSLTALADLGGGAWGTHAPPWASKFFRFHAVFGKIWRVHAPPGGFTPPLGKILDPPLDWLNGTDLESETDNRLRQYNPTSHWCYADYNHMKELFCDYPDLIKVKIKILSLSCGIIYDHIF